MDVKKMTAVEWLEEIFLDNEGILTSNQLIQAKAFEKQQIVKAFYDGCIDTNSWRTEQYYNETFNK